MGLGNFFKLKTDQSLARQRIDLVRDQPMLRFPWWRSLAQLSYGVMGWWGSGFLLDQNYSSARYDLYKWNRQGNT